jgi:hypothetical protein
MKFFRKNLLSFSAIALFSFAFISVTEDFHQHNPMESQDDCAFCSFIQTSSHAIAAPIPPTLTPHLFVITLFVVQFLFVSFRSVSPRGRSPPQILL